MDSARQNYNYQKVITLVAVLLFLLKLVAWYLTNSVAILTDALESTVNVFSAFIGLYSLYLSAKPRDTNHPYGHGKVEFVSAAIEGTLIFVAGLIIIYEVFRNITHPHEIASLDKGIYFIGVSAVINYITGYIAVHKGKKSNSLALIASGKHLQTDTYTTLGIILGLALILITGFQWIDSAVAAIFALVTLFTGYKIIRGSLAGIMDEADRELLQKIVSAMEANRNENWIDLHNLRIIKYGTTLHLDCHMTVPWYITVRGAHEEVDRLDKMLKNQFGESVEMFLHTDGCIDSSCPICDKMDCKVRQFPFQRKPGWTIENISSNQKHNINTR